MSFFEAIVLGVTQGIAEWLPISSEGVTAFLGVRFFSGITTTEIIRLSLFLHLGTMLAAIIYFKKDLVVLFKNLAAYNKIDKGARNIIRFYVVATTLSGVIGLFILKGIEFLESFVVVNGRTLLFALSAMLLITGVLQLKRREDGHRKPEDANLTDGIVLGIAQGFSALPGLSRSGLTVASLLLRDFGDKYALQMSFIMSLPVVLAGNILLNTSNFALTLESFISVLFSFIFGIASMHILIKFAKKIQFGWFVIAFSALVAVSAFLWEYNIGV